MESKMTLKLSYSCKSHTRYVLLAGVVSFYSCCSSSIYEQRWYLYIIPGTFLQIFSLLHDFEAFLIFTKFGLVYPDAESGDLGSRRWEGLPDACWYCNQIVDAQPPIHGFNAALAWKKSPFFFSSFSLVLYEVYMILWHFCQTRILQFSCY